MILREVSYSFAECGSRWRKEINASLRFSQP